MLFWFASKLRVNSSVPKLFHGLPVLNLPASYYILQVVRLLVQESVFSDVEIKLGVLELLVLSCSTGLVLLEGVSDDSWDDVAGLHVA